MNGSWRAILHQSGGRRPADGVALLFVVYWALILPFICWGSWAQVGHPHARPHFVFALPQLTAVWTYIDPTLTVGNSATPLAAVAAQLFDSHCATVVGDARLADGGPGVTAQATPVTLATLLLSFVAPLLALLLCLPVMVRRRLPSLRPTICPLAVGTPPPRHAGCTLFALSAPL
jgi:hypothetical protein